MGILLSVLGQPVDPRTMDQIERCLDHPAAIYGALNADNHLGYSMPIGGVIAHRNAVSPTGVGYDIGCGNKAVLTNWSKKDIQPHLTEIMDRISNELEFGIGKKNPEKIDHAIFDDMRWKDIQVLTALKDPAREQLGTIGSGNHYVDLFYDELDRIWIGVHFGSRGFGFKICAGFMNLSKGLEFDGKHPQGGYDDLPTLFNMVTELGIDYFAAMQLAGEYAYAGRNFVCNKVLDILGSSSLEEVHNHHNFAWEEEHFGEKLIVVRKGATPAWPGQKCFIGGSMGDISVIAHGIDSEQSKNLLRSTVHGAGRVMSRTKAAGKFKKIDGKRQRIGGEVTQEMMTSWLREKNVILRGGGTDESPQVYKRLPAVLDEHSSSLKLDHILHPIGVVMAGEDTFDPYKD